MKQAIHLIALALATPTFSVPVDGSERVLDLAGCLALKAGKTLGAGLLPFGGAGAGVMIDLLCSEIINKAVKDLPIPDFGKGKGKDRIIGAIWDMLKPKEPGVPGVPDIPVLPEIPKLPGLPDIPNIFDNGKGKGKGKDDHGKGKGKGKGKDL